MVWWQVLVLLLQDLAGLPEDPGQGMGDVVGHVRPDDDEEVAEVQGVHLGRTGEVAGRDDRIRPVEVVLKTFEYVFFDGEKGHVLGHLLPARKHDRLVDDGVGSPVEDVVETLVRSFVLEELPAPSQEVDP